MALNGLSCADVALRINSLTRRSLLQNRDYVLNKIVSVFHFTVTVFETEIKLFQQLKAFWNYFKIISATLNMLENIHELQQDSGIILKQFQARFHTLK